MIQVKAIGGYNEVGKNMTAINIDGDVIVLDMGVQLDHYIAYKGDEEPDTVSSEEMIKVGAVPDVSILGDWKNKVKAIIPTHAHLDHIGAIPFLAYRFKADIFCTPYTAEVIEAMVKENKRKLRNHIVRMKAGSSYKISKNIKVEFINMTHSTPQTVSVAIHTKYGIIFYCNDFKLDNAPVLGKKPDYKRIKQLGKKGVALLIMDSLYSRSEGTTPSESIAREKIMKIFTETEFRGAIFTSTFSSHIARLKTIVDACKKIKRKPIFLGRSLYRYITAAQNVGIVDFRKIEIAKYGKQIRRTLKKLEPEKEKYVFIATGHQGEPDSALGKLVNDELRFKFDSHDSVIFSCTVIPTEMNIENREKMEEVLAEKGVSIFKDAHVSGHGRRDDQRKLIEMLNPANVVPSHGDKEIVSGMKILGKEMGLKLHFLHNGSLLEL